MRLQETIAHFKMKLSSTSREYEERIFNMRSDKEKLQIHFQKLKRRMQQYRENQRKKFVEMTLLSDDVVKKLNDRVEKAETILKLVEMNEKLESEEDKCVPFYTNTVKDAEEVLFLLVRSLIFAIIEPPTIQCPYKQSCPVVTVHPDDSDWCC